MLRIALKNVLARKGRLLLSALAVIAGCTFLSGVFVFSDTINGSIDSLFATAYDKTDGYVRSASVIESDFGDGIRGTIPDTDVAEVAAAPGVKSAVGDVVGTAIVTNDEDKVLGGEGPPQFGSVFNPDDLTTPWSLKDGRAPSGGSEVVLDVQTAKLGNVEVGDTVTVSVTNDPREFTVVGIVRFAGADSTGGPTWALFDLPTAQEFVLGEPGMISSINIAGDGSLSQEAMRSEIQKLFDPDKVEVLTGTEITEESQSDLAKQFSFFTLFLTAFALISIFVSCFVIYNVFKISAAQRLRENALLRAIGARSSQVTFALFVEALVVGILGAVLGFAGGVALATGITAVLSSSGGFADTSLVVSPSAFIITLIVGLTVTLVCATFPAIRAGRVPPLAAMRDVSIDKSSGSRNRLIVAGVSAALAVLGIWLGISSTAEWLGLGVIGLFIAVIAVGPFVVGRLADLMTKPLGKIRGVTGEVAGRNAARSPERTALTAAALGIGLALLIMVSTLASSLEGSLRDTFGQAFNGQMAVAPKNPQGGIIPTTVADDINALPEISAATGIGVGAFTVVSGDEPRDSGAILVDPQTIGALFDIEFEAGGLQDLGGNNLVVSKDRADADDLTLGSTFDVTFLNQDPATFTVVGIFSDDLFGNYIADRSAFLNSGQPLFDFQVIANAADGVSVDQALAAVDQIVETKYPTAEAQTKNEFIDKQISSIDGFITFIYALLFMSVFIAVLGIVLTLLLSVYERRRELGLMRAIGTTRGQVRGSVRWESVLTAILGAMMGAGLGIGLGWIIVKALEDQGLSKFAISPSTIVIFFVLSIVFALVAAIVPAGRAAKAPILEAIATT